MNKELFKKFLVDESSFRNYIRNNEELSPDFLENYIKHIRNNSDIILGYLDELEDMTLNLKNGQSFKVLNSEEDDSADMPFFKSEDTVKNRVSKLQFIDL